MAARQKRLLDRIKDKDFKLQSLLETTKAINNKVGTDELLAIYKTTLKDDLKIEKVILFAFDGAWKCILKYGVEGEIGEIADEAYFNQSNTISLNIESSVTDEAFDIVIPVSHNDKPIAYLLVGDIGEQEIKVSPVIKHMNFIQTFTNVILVAIENEKMTADILRQERTKKELELAAEMQALLVPDSLPKNDLHEIAAVYKPHQQVGGDYYDFMQLNEKEIMFCMADVSGKGVSAAFLMSNFQAYLRAIFTYCSMTLEEVVRELNERVMSSAMGEKYITFFIAIFNNETRELRYINCGHNPPVSINPKGESELLSLGSIGLGMFEEIPTVAEGQLILEKNALVVCYTDGLVELENEQNEEYSLEALEKLILENLDRTPEQLNRIIMNSLEDYRGSMPYIDDTALLTCRLF
ncbi:MAG: sigma-B regulation protein RsbU (phosphoserine phosphatase) [Flavobacteriales bacterium]|jgi:sigma-B regulation protein RsbU (phosphoserine phosphatase)